MKTAKKPTKAAMIERIGQLIPEAKGLKRMRHTDLSKLLAKLDRKAAEAAPVIPEAIPVAIPLAIVAPPIAMLASPRVLDAPAPVPAKVDTRPTLADACFAAVYVLIRATVGSAFQRQKN